MLPPWLRDSLRVILLVYAWWTIVVALVLVWFPAKPERGGAKKHPWRWVIVALPGVSYLFGAFFFVAHRKDRRVWIPAAMYIVLVAVGLAAAFEIIGPSAELKVGPRQTIVRDWRLDSGSSAKAARDPQLCLAMSGGGIRSAAFNMGVLRGLHELEFLDDVDVISAVSGGTYTLSWLMRQPFYADQNRPNSATAQVVARMFDPSGPYQKTLESSANLTPVVELPFTGLLGATLYQLPRALMWNDVTGANLFGPRMMYRT